MLISEKRIAANRANAAKSTGPRSEEGKRNSSRNAVKHGFLSKAILIDGESHQRFNDLLDSLHAEFQSETPTERALVEKMAVCQWRRLRLWTTESAGITREMRLQSDAASGENSPTRAALAMRSLGDRSGHAEAMNRFEHRFDLQYHNALRDLMRLKDRKRAQNAAELNQATLIADNKE